MVDDKPSILDSQNHMHVKINEEKKIRFDTSHAGPGKYHFLIEQKHYLILFRYSKGNSSKYG
jgi:hypothetical protein